MTDLPAFDKDMVLKLPIDDIDDTASRKGNLKIFLGYCAGVGKTYRMLQEAALNKRNNVDVVVGIVETHGRKETEALLSELEVVPRKNIEYASITVSEMDLDAILARRPQLVLVDELAHTNILGMRHTKRYQDVEELLNAGIDVCSTLNIQHVQSLVDIVYDVVNVKVSEIVPDRILGLANEIELVDLPPEKLQQRLVDGKVYIPQKAKQAIQRFFKKGNLLALRELSLKYTAKRVDIDLLSYREHEDISNIWPVETKVLVGISENKITEKVLLIAHRMATDMKASWYAVHVESPQQVKHDEKSRNQLYRNMHLADELGAQVITLTGNTIATELVKFAKQKNITLIITGLSQRSRFQEFLRGSVLNQLVKKSGPINVLVVGDNAEYMPRKTARRGNGSQEDSKPYVLGSIGVLATAIIYWLMPKWLSTSNMLMLMLLPTIASGIFWSVKVNVFTSALAIALMDFFFIPPLFTFAVTNKKYLWSFGTFFVVSLAVSSIGRFISWRAENARYREHFISALYNFGREMMVAENLADILSRAVKSISAGFETDVMVLLPDENEQLELVAKNKPDLVFSEVERAVAMWVYKNGQPAGKGSATLSSAKWYYLPLKVKDKTIGVICLIKIDVKKNFTPEQKRLLESFIGVVALTLTKNFNSRG